MKTKTQTSASGRGWLQILAVAGMTALGGMAAPAAASARTAFSGTCQLSGSVSFVPPLTAAPQNGDVYGQATGSCTGSLADGRGDARPVNGDKVTTKVHSQGTESCAFGSGTGAGYLAIDGRRLDFTYRELRTGPALVLRATGTRGGSALAQANVSPSANPLTTLEACGSTGLTQAPIDIRLATTPTIFG